MEAVRVTRMPMVVTEQRRRQTNPLVTVPLQEPENRIRAMAWVLDQNPAPPSRLPARWF